MCFCGAPLYFCGVSWSVSSVARPLQKTPAQQGGTACTSLLREGNTPSSPCMLAHKDQWLIFNPGKESADMLLINTIHFTLTNPLP